MARLTTTIIECDAPKCPVRIKVGEKDTPSEAFNLLHVIIADGKDAWFCGYAHLIEWAKTQKPLFDSNEPLGFDETSLPGDAR